MTQASSISIVVPALNEEENLEAAIESVRQIVPRFFPDWEILIFDDGSTDTTGEIADRLAAGDSRIKVTHHASPHNLGGCYREGVMQSTKDLLILIPGDNECGAEVLEPVLEMAGTTDIIIPYTDNPEVRPLARRLLSRGFVGLMNILSGRRLRYYNGAVLHRTALLRDCPFRTDGFGYQAEILVKLLGRGRSYTEVPTQIRYRPHGRSKAFHIRNLIQLVHFVGTLAVDSITPVNKT